MRELHVPNLEHAAAGHAAVLITARDHLARLADRVTAQGGNYSTDRVRRSTEHVTTPARPAEPLPKDIPLPAETQAHSGSKAYKGTKAHTIVRLIPGDGSWHVHRLPTGEHIALSWRHLLPHE